MGSEILNLKESVQGYQQKMRLLGQLYKGRDFWDNCTKDETFGTTVQRMRLLGQLYKGRDFRDDHAELTLHVS